MGAYPHTDRDPDRRFPDPFLLGNPGRFLKGLTRKRQAVALGKGFTQGTQSQLHFLRVRHTDFIFAVTAEELGFLGGVAMMVLIFVLLWRTIRIAERARDTFGRLIASGVAGVILFQSVVNIGMNLGLLPVTGIPLPLVSYGGSSFLTLMLGLGLVESIAVRRKKLEFD